MFQDDQRGKLKLQPEYILVSVSIADEKRVLSSLASPWVVRSREIQYESPLGFTALNLLQDLDAWTSLPMKHSGIWGSPAISSCMLGRHWRTSKSTQDLCSVLSCLRSLNCVPWKCPQHHHSVLVLCSRRIYSTAEDILLSRNWKLIDAKPMKVKEGREEKCGKIL